MEVQTTLVSHETKSGSSAKGPWTRHLFKDSVGNTYQTFKQDIANQAFGLLNQPVVLSYEATQNGQYTNNDITAVRSANGAVPTLAAPAAAPQATAPVSTGISPEQRAKEIRIMRQSALERAIATVAGGIVQVQGVSQLFALAETFVKYFAGGPEAAIPGVQTAVQTAGAGDSSSTPGGGGVAAGPEASAPPVAPAPAPATAPQGLTDDIPFNKSIDGLGN